MLHKRNKEFGMQNATACMEKLCKWEKNCWQIPEKEQVYVKVGENIVHSVKSLNLIVGKTLKHFVSLLFSTFESLIIINFVICWNFRIT